MDAHDLRARLLAVLAQRGPLPEEALRVAIGGTPGSLVRALLAWPQLLGQVGTYQYRDRPRRYYRIR